MDRVIRLKICSEQSWGRGWSAARCLDRMNGVRGTIFAGRTTDFFLKDARKANGVRIAHLAANQIEFIVGFANQTAGFFHAQRLTVTAERSAAHLGEQVADVAGMQIEMFSQISQRKILREMSEDIITGAFDMGFITGSSHLGLDTADLQIDDSGHAVIQAAGSGGALNDADDIIRCQFHLAENRYKGGVLLQNGINHSAQQLTNRIDRRMLGAYPAQKEMQKGRVLVGLHPYCITKALIDAVKGDVENGLVFCGANTGRIREMMTVKELMAELTGTC